MQSQILDHPADQIAIDAETRQLICYLAALDAQRPFPDVAINWETARAALEKHGLVNIAHAFIDRLPHEFQQQIAEEHRVSLFYNRLMHRRTAATLAALNAAKIDHMVVKGPVLAFMIYPDPTLRPYKDLDIVVREQDWGRVHQQLIKMGFDPLGTQPQPPPKLIPQQVAYESEYRHPETRLLVEVHYDDILNAGLKSRDVAGFWQRSVECEIGGVTARTMALSDQLLHLCAHAHHHAYAEMKWLTDIGLILSVQAADLDWDQFIRTTWVEEAQVSAYYSLLLVGKMLDIHAPAWVMDAIQPDAFRRFWHEQYLPTLQIMSLQPMPTTLLSFYFLPLLTRMLPNLLVMGRRPEKLYYLLRLLTPPPAWLRHYYDLAPKESLLVHYLLHPAKLFYHYAAEIWNHLFRRPA